jgi:hypothetical protein
VLAEDGEARSTAAPASDTAPHPDAEVLALAAEFEAAYAEHALVKGHRTNEEIEAADERMREIAAKFAALPSTDISMLRLKARVYLWAEGTDLEDFDTRDFVSGPVLVSLFRDLLADDPIFAAIAQHIVARDALIEAIPRADKVTAKREGREVTKADEDAVEALNLDEEAAFLERFVIVPTTLEGRRALLQHLVQRDEDGISEPIGEIAAKMLSLPIFAQEEARS